MINIDFDLRKIIGYPFIVFSLIVYIYFLKINFFPVYLILPYLFLGLCIFIFEVIRRGLEKKYFYYFFLVILSTVWASFSYIYNVDSDLFFVKENLILSLIFFFSAFSIKYIYKLSGVDFNFKNIVFFASLALAFQLIFSLIVNFIPSLFNAVIQIVSIDGLSSDVLQDFSEARLVGIGASFFASGILNSFVLILLAYNVNYLCDKKNYYVLLMLYLIISIVGILFSRTTIIGILLSSLFFINYKSLFKVLVLVVPSLILLVIYGKSLAEENNQIAFGLDFLFNFEDSQASSSFGGLKEMYEILPDNVKTWVLGDAKYKVVSQSGDFLAYYKDTDVGYFRVIFYNGLVGLFLFFLMTFYLLKKSFYFSRALVFLLLVCFLALNLKGVANVYFFCFLFFLVDFSFDKNQFNNDKKVLV
ncbi:hypothetical protein A7P54_18485 [Acinetobacter sp. Ac_3412]|uniref:hypothetical protein n=1 Tax=Acinetobacter sp. Ac_3412 TaxID=1848935 RepID=UPI001490835E|nr:hypothetical protein [Acinetobacter sp. Ac_3412]NNP75075.1 hypothetical protein [Acinetobacter sp. Ac_3412]